MPTPVARPDNLQLPFANSGSKNTIPVASQIGITAGAASFTDGFPPLTMTPIAAGGIPPSGLDMNGIMFNVSSHIVFLNAGGRYRFDATLATAIGGYPVGFVLQSDDGESEYVNILANNSTNFNSTPAAIGVSWIPYAGAGLQQRAPLTDTGAANAYTAVNAPPLAALPGSGFIQTVSIVNLNTGASTYAPDGLTAKPIYGLGLTALTGGELPVKGVAVLMYVVATTVNSGNGAWVILHCTGGAQQLPAGTYVAAPAGGDSSTKVPSTAWVNAAIEARAGDYCIDTGAANAYVIALNPPISSYTESFQAAFKATHANTTGSTINAGGGAVSLLRDNGTALQSGDIPINSVVSFIYNFPTNTAYMVSMVPSQTLTQAAADARYLMLAGTTPMTGPLTQAVGANIASASTINLTNATGNGTHITGTVQINAVTLAAGKFVWVVFDGILNLVHNATTNNIPTAGTIVTAAGDRALYWSDGTVVYCLSYVKFSGAPVIDPAVFAATQSDMEAQISNSVYATPASMKWNPGVGKVGCMYDTRTGAASVTVSNNIASLTDNGPGDVTQVYTTAFSTANYWLFAQGSRSGAGGNICTLGDDATFSQLAGSCRYVMRTVSGTAVDAYNNFFSAWGDQ